MIHVLKAFMHFVPNLTLSQICCREALVRSSPGEDYCSVTLPKYRLSIGGMTAGLAAGVILSHFLGLRASAGQVSSLPYEGTSRALVIGIGNYLNGDEWTPLEYAVPDAWRVACALHQHGFAVELLVDGLSPSQLTEQCSYDDCRPQEMRDLCPAPGSTESFRIVQREKDDPISADDLAGRMRDFFARWSDVAPKSRLLLWYSGHGTTWPWPSPDCQSATGSSEPGRAASGEGLIVAGNAPGECAPDFLQHVVPIREVASWSRLSPANHVLVVMDSCFAGTVFEQRSQIRPFVSPLDLVDLPVRQFITAGGSTQKVPDDGEFAAMFSRAILGQEINFSGQYDRGFFTGSELGDYLQRTIGARRDRKQAPQWGELEDARFGQGDFLFDGTQHVTSTPQDLGAAPPIGEQLPRRFRDCSECPWMVTIPGTRFAISVHEITFADWEACGSACGEGLNDQGWGRGQQPVIGVTLDNVHDYARWLSARSHEIYRLPTSTEWEKAARGGKAADLSYWWGSSMKPGYANCHGCDPRSKGRPFPVGSFTTGREHPFGLRDVLGNVWEWVEDPIEGEAPRAVVRGGSWANDDQFATFSSELVIPRDSRSAAVGFRILREWH